MDDSVIAAYQRKWKTDVTGQARLAYQERVYQAFSKLFDVILKEKFQGSILDIGCGDGALVALLNTKAGISCQGVDIDHGVNFEKDKLPFKDNEFDIVIMYSVIE